jgi:hypothetical protein
VQKPSKRPTGTIKKNELVFVGSDKKKRIDWPMGRVIELYPGKDDEVRVVKVRTANGELTRPVKRIYALELSNENCVDSTKDRDSPTEHEKHKEHKKHEKYETHKTKHGRLTIKPVKYV